LNIITLILQIFCSILHSDHKWNIHCLETGTCNIKCEVLTAVNIKTVFFWDMMLVPTYQTTRCHLPDSHNTKTHQLYNKHLHPIAQKSFMLAHCFRQNHIHL
jgi:hypothetical protein